MRIDGPKGLGSWLQGFFSGSFKGNIDGPAYVEGPVIASSKYLHVQGNIIVSGNISQGYGTKAIGAASHAEGSGSIAIGVASHAEGRGTKAKGIGSHAEGLGTIASGDHQHVMGTYNIEDESNDTLLIVGNGTSEESRSNALTLNREGLLSVNKLHVKDSMEVDNMKVEDLEVSGSIITPSLIVADPSESSDTIRISSEISGSVIKVSQVVIRQYLYETGSTGSDSPVAVEDRVILEYNSGSGCLEFVFQ